MYPKTEEVSLSRMPIDYTCNTNHTITDPTEISGTGDFNPLKDSECSHPKSAEYSVVNHPILLQPENKFNGDVIDINSLMELDESLQTNSLIPSSNSILDSHVPIPCQAMTNVDETPQIHPCSIDQLMTEEITSVKSHSIEDTGHAGINLKDFAKSNLSSQPLNLSQQVALIDHTTNNNNNITCKDTKNQLQRSPTAQHSYFNQPINLIQRSPSVKQAACQTSNCDVLVNSNSIIHVEQQTQSEKLVSYLSTSSQTIPCSGKNNYALARVGQNMTNQTALAVYQRIPSHQRIYQCTMCDAKYSTKDGLTFHVRRHTGEKPFECTVCPKKFAQKSHLTSHMKVHTRETSFDCPECEAKFLHKHNLNRHMRRHAIDEIKAQSSSIDNQVLMITKTPALTSP